MATLATSPFRAIAGLFDRGFDPATARKLPLKADSGESNVKGMYLAGEVAGTPLIKLGLNRGRAVVDHIVNVDLREELGERTVKLNDDMQLETQEMGWDRSDAREGDWHDILIIGAGSAGLGAADRCQQLGLHYVVIEQQRPAQLVRNMTKGKPLLMEPPNEDNQTRMFCEECKKEDLLEHWDRQIVELGLDQHINAFEAVTDIQRQGDKDGFKVTTDKGEYLARRVIMAIGKGGNPRKLRVAGEQENAARISQNVADPDEFSNQDLLVFGAGDVACEAAIALAEPARGNRVTMVAPDKEFTFPKQRNIDGVMKGVEEGRIDLHLGHVADKVDADTVTIKALDGGATQDVKAEHIFRCIGADLPLKFFKKTGIVLEGTWTMKRWMVLLFAFVICHFIYGVKKSPSGIFPYNIPLPGFGPDVTLYKLFADLHVGSGNWRFDFNGAFWYSLAYCLAMTIWGLKAYKRWGVDHDDSYQRKRFITLITVQWTLAFLIPMGLMWVVHGIFPDNPILGRRYNHWHASGFEYAFPLFFMQFVWDVGWLYLIYGLVATFIVIPITTIRHGKRYCTWFCGCGGLAETLGDQWRHLAPKGRVAGRWEWMNFAVLAWAFVAMILVVGKFGLGQYVSGSSFSLNDDGTFTAGAARGMFHSYDMFVDLWLVGIIPVALYPIFGGKIWCRYWCPLAKMMQITSKWFGTLQISSDDKCITCGECSRYCEVGIDVMSFAKNQESFGNENTSCIQCGVCVTVCPMDVLSFDNDRTPEIMKLVGGSKGIGVTVEGQTPAPGNAPAVAMQPSGSAPASG